jgi:hypothetical protein
MYVLLRAIRFLAFGLTLTSFVVCLEASTYFYANRPAVPCPEENRTYALSNHGFIVYLTREEHRLVDWSFNASLCLFFVGLALLAIEENWGRKKGK